MIDQHGVEAPIHAAMRADEMLDVGDLDGQAVWKAILKAVIELENEVPEGTVHWWRTMSACGYERKFCKAVIWVGF